MTSGVALGSRAVAGRKVTARKAVISKPRAAVAVQASGDRKWNFSAGPACLPLDVLEDCKEDLINYKGTGMSVMEMSHRGKDFMKIAEEAEADLPRARRNPRQLQGTSNRPIDAAHPKHQSNPRYFHPPNRRRLPAAFARTRSNVSDRASPNHPSRSTHRFSSSRAARPPSSPPFP